MPSLTWYCKAVNIARETIKVYSFIVGYSHNMCMTKLQRTKTSKPIYHLWQCGKRKYTVYLYDVKKFEAAIRKSKISSPK